MIEILCARHPVDRGWVSWTECSDDRAEGRVDLLALQCWGSPYVVGYECKASRSDWLREVDNPAKREWLEATCRFRWFAAKASVIRRAELPAGWGLIEVGKTRARRIVAAPAHAVPAPPKWLARRTLRAAQEIERAQEAMRILRAEHDPEVWRAEKARRQTEIVDAEIRVKAERGAVAQERGNVEEAWREVCRVAGVDVFASWDKRARRIPTHEIAGRMRAFALKNCRDRVDEAERAIASLRESLTEETDQ